MLRPGTENLAGIVGLGVAAELAVAELDAESARLATLRDRLQRDLSRRIPDVSVNAAAAPRLPHLLNLSLRGVDLEALLISLDLEGIAVSSGAACQSGAVEPSHVLTAMGCSRENEASIRLSLGRTTTEDDIADVLARFPAVVERLRRESVTLTGVA
jgi:cysteine desulfurase